MVRLVQYTAAETKMRGQERNIGGQERNIGGCESGSEPPRLLRFSTADLPEVDRIAQWQDVVGRTLTGCTSSTLEGGALEVEFSMAAGDATRVAVTRLRNVRNNRDRACLRDGDDDLVFFSPLSGEGLLEHNGQRIRLRRGEGMLARFDRTLDTSWKRSDLMLIRLSRHAVRGIDPDAAVGRLQPATSTLMKLLQSYARTAWREAARTGALAPIADRHIAELVAALCASDSVDAGRRARPAIGPARVAAMREIIARAYANPCLSMRQVAEAVGVSGRAGYLAFKEAGLSFTDELHAVRLERAREQLLGSDARVIDVAFATGFSDASHFHRLFKRRFGCRPVEIRRC